MAISYNAVKFRLIRGMGNVLIFVNTRDVCYTIQWHISCATALIYHNARAESAHTNYFYPAKITAHYIRKTKVSMKDSAISRCRENLSRDVYVNVRSTDKSIMLSSILLNLLRSSNHSAKFSRAFSGATSYSLYLSFKFPIFWCNWVTLSIKLATTVSSHYRLNLDSSKYYVLFYQLF